MNKLAFIQNLRAPELLMIIALFLPLFLISWILIRRFYTQVENRNEGFSRLKYLLWMVGIGISLVAIASQSTPSDVQVFSIAAFLASLYPLNKRIKNIGFSSSWMLLSVIPILNVWLNLFVLFCPALKRKREKN
jgi:hypothetical protein